LKVAISEVRSDPPLVELVSPPDWGRIGALAEALEYVSTEAFLAAWDGLQRRMP
jgi:hypothetical protein